MKDLESQLKMPKNSAVLIMGEVGSYWINLSLNRALAINGYENLHDFFVELLITEHPKELELADYVITTTPQAGKKLLSRYELKPWQHLIKLDIQPNVEINPLSNVLNYIKPYFEE